MGVENTGQPTPPKKKLKQAQLPFCIITPKANKRKLSNAEDAAEEVPVKVLCQQASNLSKNILSEKENVEVISAVKLVPVASLEQNDLDQTTKVEPMDEEEIVTINDDDAENKSEAENDAEESVVNVSATSEVQSSGCDRSMDCSLVLSISTSDSEGEEAPNGGSTLEAQKGKETNGDVAKTPKQTKKLERRAERERLRKEKELERERQKEEKLRVKQEKEIARKKEKEDKEQKRLAEIRAKDEEKKKKEEAKEEARRQKELDRKRKEDAKEEEKRKKEGEKIALERKENLAKEAFSKFFKRAKTSEVESGRKEPEKQIVQKFMPFPVKNDMRLASVCRVKLPQEAKDELTSLLENPSEKDATVLYLKQLKTGGRKPGKSEATWPSSDEVHDVIIIESVKDENEELEKTVEIPVKKKQSFRAKLFQFRENRRPPYWGTWRKRSNSVSARRPFGKEKSLDYEVDSDSEWEDEGEGEDLEEKENESDNENEQSDDENVGENGYLIDSVFVPHGYLSDEEAEDEDNCDPESQKLRMTALKLEFDEEMKQSTNRLQPKVLGCVWISNETTEVSKGSLYQVLMNHRCVWNEEDGPIDLSGPVVEDTPPTPQTAQKSKFPESLIEPLVKLVHGSELSHIALVKEFMSYLEKEEVGSTASKRAVSHKIKDIAVKSRSANGPAWHVSADLCDKFGLPFVIEKKTEEPVNSEPVTPRGVPPLTNFFKKKPPGVPPKDPLTEYPEIKKRVVLISLPRLEVGEGKEKYTSGKSANAATSHLVDQTTVKPEKPSTDTIASVPPPPAPESTSTPTPSPAPESTSTPAQTAPISASQLVPAQAPPSTSELAPPSTSDSSVTPKLKKRITPITLSRTPSTPTDQQPAQAHKDTPRPIHTFFKTFQKH